MQEFLLSSLFALMAYVFVKTQNSTGKLVTAVVFGIISYLIFQAEISRDTKLVVDYGDGITSETLANENDATVREKIQQLLGGPQIRQVITGYEYDEDIGFDVNAIENKYIVNGKIQPTLKLVRGNVYRFWIPNKVYGEFPFYFSESNQAGGAYIDSEYIFGMSRTQDQDYLIMNLEATSETPDELYYHSGTQRDMGGRIQIVTQKLAYLQ